MTRRVSGPSRKATPSLICLTEASRPDLASPAYSHPSHVPLRSPFMISSRNAFYYLTTRPGITASTLRLPCVSPASCILISSLLRPASPCVLLRSPCVLLRSPCVLLRSPCVLLRSPCVLLRSPCVFLRSPRVLLRHLASASCVLCGLVVSRTFRRFPGPERVYSPPCVYLPSCSDHPLPVP